MSQFEIDEATNDLKRTDGAMTRVTGAVEIKQHVKLRLLLYIGECPLNTSLGMEYFAGGFLDKGTPESVQEAEITEAILGTPGIVSVEDVTLVLDKSARNLKITWEATGELGDLRRRIPLHDTVTVPVAA